MQFNAEAVRECLQQGDLKTLFLEHLGWDHHAGQLAISVGNHAYLLTAVAQKRGFAVYTCPTIPDRNTRLKIDRQVTQSAREHLLIYIDEQRGEQVWQWVRREPGKPLTSRELALHRGQSGEPIVQRLRELAVSLEEEEQITLLDITERVRRAFDVDKVTKRFYEQFKAKHAEFLKQIQGIDAPAEREWYASVMLNRLMFVYFIQKKGFLDNNTDYLRDRLTRVQALRGKNQFLSFYRYFLLKLFHEGLGKPPNERQLDAEFEQLLGKVPYLNGGFFEVHELEKRYPNLEIPDEAFVKLFDFFDQYAWHLDERPLRADNEINPDVIGYIFEKYVNQKQMGAYYTKEDITEYISKNTIIPFLFDAARKKCAVAFEPESALWRLLRDDPDRYIYPAVRHGVVREDGTLVPESELPDFVQQGMHDPNARMFDKRYNLEQAPAGDPIRLPTETWREYVHRRQRCLELRQKLQSGEVHDINDLITLNLDIWQFARDAILNCEGPELLRSFWQALQHLSVLDPTCGSGAFLFAALNILETLYSDCLERMQQFLEDLEGKPHHPDKFRDFREVLRQVEQHPNERYFILKSIIINNLYGVDIMEEAVEICKLRLFLKLAAQVATIDQLEPLPDIDFNIRAGNTLVGFATIGEVRKSQEGKLALDEEEIRRIEEEATLVEKAYNQFRAQQTQYGGRVTAADKQHLRDRLRHLTDQLDRYLALLYGVNLEKPEAFHAWKASHQPFHWCAEFYGIMRTGGFDVIIGNPPYVSTAKVRKSYTVIQYATERCPDIYAWCLERASQLVQSRGYTGMIVPLSLTFSSDFAPLRMLLYSEYQSNWFSSFGRIPTALFSHDVRVRNTIHIGTKQGNGYQYTTRLHRWFEVERNNLFRLISYAKFTPQNWSYRIPKLNTQALVDAFEQLAREGKRLDFATSPFPTKHRLYFKKTAYNWLTFSRALPPCYDDQGKPIPHTKFGEVYFREADTCAAGLCLLNGKIMLAFWFAIGDDFDVTRWMFTDFPYDISCIPEADKQCLVRYADHLEIAMREATSFKLNAGKRVGNYNLARCRHVTDETDMIFVNLFGFEHVWEDIELLYTQCVRTDFSSEEDDS